MYVKTNYCYSLVHESVNGQLYVNILVIGYLSLLHLFTHIKYILLHPKFKHRRNLHPIQNLPVYMISISKNYIFWWCLFPMCAHSSIGSKKNSLLISLRVRYTALSVVKKPPIKLI